MKTILASAYAINPYKGSEDGMGWNFVMQIARFNKVIAITRENNRPQIEQYMHENPSDLYDRVRFLYFDLPYWMRFWKKGGRGAMLYYLMWQRGIVSFIKRQQIDYDIVHNLNFHNDWTPSYLWKLRRPFVWGSVGHHPLIPSQYLKPYPTKYKVQDRATWLVKKYFWNFSRSLKRTISHADHVLCMNSGVPEALGLRSRFAIVPSVATQDFGWNGEQQSRSGFRVISAGRFVPLKGFDLTLRAYAKFFHGLSASERPNCELVLVGSGPEEQRLKALARSLDVVDSVKFIAWIKRDELMSLFKESAVFLFPSHEGAGMVVAEALSFGLPVVCLDNEGPGQFINKSCGFAIQQGGYEDTVVGLAGALDQLYGDPKLLSDMKIAARRRFETQFHWDRRGEMLQKIYAEIC
jgi:glycosyltransferase involved in cell wall biosynthesis